MAQAVPAAPNVRALTAVGATDPYWSDPSEEEPRMARIFACIGGTGTGTLPGRDFGYAGLAHYGRKPGNVVLIDALSSSDNAVIGEYETDDAGTPSINVYWLRLNPADRAACLARGNPSLIEELSIVEAAFLGVELVRVAVEGGGVRFIVTSNAQQLQHIQMDLLTDSTGMPMLKGTLSGKPAFVQYAYVQFRRGLAPGLSLSASAKDAIEYIRLCGSDMTPGSEGQRVVDVIRAP